MGKPATKRIRQIAVACFAVAVLFAAYSVATAADGGLLSFQGRLTDGVGNLLGGQNGATYYYRFSIYNSATGGTLLWENDATNGVPTKTTQGVFNVLLGDAGLSNMASLSDSVFATDPFKRWLEVEVSTISATGPFETMTPRQRVGGALVARSVFGGISSVSQTYGSGLEDCNLAGQKLLYDGLAGTFSCGTDLQGSGGTSIEVGEGTADAGVLVSSVSFNAGAFNVNTGSGYLDLNLDWVNGPASRALTNVWTGLNTFAGGASVSNHFEVSGVASISQLVLNGTLFNPNAYLPLTGGTLTGALIGTTASFVSASTSGTFETALLKATTIDSDTNLVQITANATVSGNFEVTGYASASSTFGSGLTNCTTANNFLQWSSSTGRFSCATATGSDNLGKGLFVREGSGAFAHVGSLSFSASGFTLSTVASLSTIGIDYTNGPASRSIAQTITGSWTFTAASNQFTNTLEIGTASISNLTIAGVSGPFLPLAGGTLTGTLFGTGASFTGNLEAALVKATTIGSDSGLTLAPTSGLTNVTGRASISSNFEVGGYASASSTFGSGLTLCTTTNSFLQWNSATGRFSCVAASLPSFSGIQVRDGASLFSNIGTISFTTRFFDVIASGSQDVSVTVASDSLNFSEFADSMILDANFRVSSVSGAFTVTQWPRWSVSLVPSAHNTYDLGTSALRWRDAYIAPGSIHIGEDLGGGADEAVLMYDPSGTTATDRFNITLYEAGVAQGFFNLFDSGSASISGGLEIGGDLVPSSDAQYSLGSSPNQWLNLWTNNASISGNLEIGGDIIQSGNTSISDNLEISGYVSASQIFGLGLTDCDGSLQKLQWSETTGMFSCGVDQTGSSGTAIGTSTDLGVFTNVTSLSFAGAHFDLTYPAGGLVKLDWGTGGPASLSQNETVTGAWTFANGASFSSLEATTASVSSLTINGSVFNPNAYLLLSGGTLTGNLFGTNASFSGSVELTGAGSFIGPLFGNATTATALAANGTNCSAGFGAGGVSASGTAEDCVDYITLTDLSATSPIAYNNLTGVISLAPGFDIPLAASTSAWESLYDGGPYLALSGGTLTGNLFGTYASLSGNLEVAGAASASSTFGSGLTSCSGAAEKLLWNSTTGQFSCGVDLQSSGGASVGLREGFTGSFTNRSSISFNGAHFTLNFANPDAQVSLDWGAGGPASLSQNETVTGNWLFSGSSTQFTNTIEVGTASVSSLTINGSVFNPAAYLLLTGGTLTGNLFGTYASFSSNLEVAGAASSSALFGSGLSVCTASQKLQYNTNGTFSCVTDQNSPFTGIQVREGATLLSGISSLSFDPGAFNITASGSSDVRITLDYINGPASRAMANAWTALNTFTYASVSNTFEVSGTASISSLTVGGVTINPNNFRPASNSLDWDEFSNAMTVDAATTINAAAGLTFTNASVSGTFETALLKATTIDSDTNLVSITANATVSGNFEVTGFASASSTFGSGLTNCSGVAEKLLWSSVTGQFSCGVDLQSSGGASVGLREGFTGSFTNRSSISFNGAHFTLNFANPDAQVSLDWGAGGPASLSQNETVTGNWLFSGSSTQFTNTIEVGTASVSSLTINGSVFNPAAYLLLTGGTLTGNLFGTYASFSSNLEVAGAASSSALFGSGLSVCTASQKLQYNTNGTFSCVTDQNSPFTGIQVREGATLLSGISSLSFDPGAFNITASGSSDVRITLDYINGPASRAMANAWTALNTFTYASVSNTFEVSGTASISSLTAQLISTTALTVTGQTTLNAASVSNAEIQTASISSLTINGSLFNPNAYLLLTGGTLTGHLNLTTASASNLELSGFASASSYYGAGLANCGPSQKLQYASGTFTCVADLDTNTLLGVREGAAAFVNYSSLSFSASGFELSPGASPIINVGIDYVNGPASRSINQSITGVWTFANGASVSNTLEVVGTASVSALVIDDGGTLYGAGLTTCNSTSQKLTWFNGQFGCGTDQGSGGGTGTLEIREFGAAYDSIPATASFAAAHFALAASGSSDVSIRLDWGAGGPASLSQNETVIGAWNFTNAVTFNTSSVSNAFESNTASISVLTIGGVLINPNNFRPASNSLDWDEFSNAMTVDAATTINAAAGLTFTNASVSGTFETALLKATTIDSDTNLVSITANTSVSGNFEVTGYASASSTFGSGLTNCTTANNFLQWNSATGTFSCAAVSQSSTFAGIEIIESGGTFGTHYGSISFNAGAFDVSFPTASSSLVKLDWINGPASRSIAQTITGAWTFTAASNQFTNTLEIGTASISNLTIAGVPFNPNAYLPLAGGTLTGALFGTHASFSGNFELGGTVSSNLTPTITNTFSLGTSALQWANVFTQNASVSNNIEIAGTASVSNLIINGTPFVASNFLLRTEEGQTTILQDNNALSFNAAHFALSASGSTETLIGLDWGNGGPASLSQNETVTGNWTFQNGASFSAIETQTASISSLTINGSPFNPNAYLLLTGGTLTGPLNMTYATVSNNFEVRGFASASQTFGSGLSTCSGTNFLQFNAGTGLFSCVAQANSTPFVWKGLSVSGDAGAFTHMGSLTFDNNGFNISKTGSLSTIFIDYTNGPASRAMANIWTAVNTFSGGASVSNRFEVSGVASISSLVLGGTTINPLNFRPASNSIDWDEIVNAMTLDANTTVTNNGFAITFTNASVSGTFETAILKATSASISGSFEATGYASASQYFGAGLTSCNGTTNKLVWSAGVFSCATDQTGTAFGGIEIINSDGTFGTHYGSISFDASHFTVTFPTASSSLVRLDWGAGGPASLSENETIAGNWVNTANPWADNEVADAITVSGGTIGSNTLSTGATFTGSATISSNFEVRGFASASQTFGSGLSTCSGTNFLQFNAGTGLFSCVAQANSTPFVWKGLSVSGDAGAFTHMGSLTFDNNGFNISKTGSLSTIFIDYTNGPASRAMANIWTAVNTFSGGASVSNRFEVSGVASISSLTLGGTTINPLNFRPASNSIDWDEIVNAMTLDANTTVTNNGFAITFTNASVSGTFETAILKATSASISGSFEATGYASASATFGSGLANCTAANNFLQWNSSTGRFSCAAATSSGSSFNGIEVTNNAGSTYAHITSLSFSENNFNITNTGSQSFIGLDWVNGPASRSAAQSITGLWTFTVGASFSNRIEVAGTASISGATTLRGITYNWPTVQGGLNTFLKNDGTGGLTWASAPTTTQDITLVPEYAGATMSSISASCTTCIGLMTSDNEIASPYRNFYKWRTTQAASQSYDIWVKVSLPNDFSSFSSVSVEGFRSSTNDRVYFAIFDTANSQSSTTSGKGTSVATSNGAWTNTLVSAPAGTYTAGQTVTFRIRMEAGQNQNVRVGKIRMEYAPAP